LCLIRFIWESKVNSICSGFDLGRKNLNEGE
jgi:hypothetical protein